MFKLTDLDARDKALHRCDERKWGLNSERKLGLEDGLRSRLIQDRSRNRIIHQTSPRSPTLVWGDHDWVFESV